MKRTSRNRATENGLNANQRMLTSAWVGKKGAQSGAAGTGVPFKSSFFPPIFLPAA